MEFKKYGRSGFSEMIEYRNFDWENNKVTVSISEADKQLDNQEFLEGYIARNPKNHEDMWYVAKKYFDENLEPYTTVKDFGFAIRALKQGYKVAREGWNGKGMYLYIPVSFEESTSLRFALPTDSNFPPKNSGWGYSSFIVMKTADNMLVPWLASQTDVLAEDWSIIE